MKESNYEILIDENLNGARLDVVLSLSVPDCSRSFLQKLIDGGSVVIDDKVVTAKNTKVKNGQKIVLTVPEPEELEIKPENIPLDIVYEDDDVLVVNKPVGMVVHPAVGNYEGTLVNAIMYHCKDSLSSINGVIRPGIVHRIDKDTSGLLMVAKNDFAHNSLAAQLAEHSITRVYNALCHDNFTEDEGTVDIPIGRDPKNRMKQGVFPYERGEVPQGARYAVTNYKVLERYGRFTLIEARLLTGRTHQIRVHMSHIHHPLVGDTVYGPKKTALGADKGQLLCARVLGFVHPRTGEYLEFETPIPEDFQRILDKLEEK